MRNKGTPWRDKKTIRCVVHVSKDSVIIYAGNRYVKFVPVRRAIGKIFRGNLTGYNRFYATYRRDIYNTKTIDGEMYIDIDKPHKYKASIELNIRVINIPEDYYEEI